ncbi:carbohydrate ABC transporter permease [Herbiconiux moechotypicola]|uniref:Carbohydrate ABC transporter permease n=1 Tax=Herbiconiux moechotypicola TaxID=637393 RepID=A0ABN3D8V8_9MICO|nr:carbohydrate ABC transporter permease [Herbiconiux moechotypicola]MCS5728182.1 carbohydrate ABC transporter permease [Herbiconiux moechotypicola]
MSRAPGRATARGPRRGRAGRILLTVLSVAILLVYLFPVFWMLSASLQPGVTSANIDWIPAAPSLDGYSTVFEDGLESLQVSIIVSAGSVLLSLFVAIPAAYALSRLTSRIVDVALVLLLLAQMIPSVVLANSFYAMFNFWGVLNTYAGLIIANSTAGIPFAIIVLRAFMLRLDHDVVEAGKLDGLGPLGSLVRIVLPLSRNAVITAGVFTFLFSWGDLLFGLTLVTQDQMYPMTVFVYALTSSQVTSWAAVMAASLVASLPALLVVFAAQRYVKAGIAVGGGR